MANDIVLGATLRANINVIKRTTEAFETISARLATGKIVNSAIDNPQNFFAARSLDNRAADFNRRLDQIGQSLSLIREAAIGTEALEKLLDQSEAIVLDSLEKNLAGEVDEALIEVEVNTSPTELSTQILNSSPVAYYRLDGAGAPVNLSTATGLGKANANNSGPNVITPSVAGYFNGATPGAAALYTNGGGTSAQFDGVNDHIQIADNNLINLSAQPARTVELVFNADTVAGRQILYEEGANVNGLTIYIDNGEVYVTAEDDGGGNRYADIFQSAAITAGETNHVAFVFSAAEDRFQGFLNGVAMGPPISIGSENFPSHSGDIHVGGGNDGVQWHDGEGTGNAFHFQGRISDVAIHNTALTDAEIFNHGTSLNATTSIRIENQEYNSIRNQIDQLVLDAQYRGVNLLNGESTRVAFNEDGSTGLDIEGQTFTTDGLALLDLEFNSENNMRALLDAITEARETVRNFGRTLQNQLTILQTRQDFTQRLINTHDAGSDDLTVADQNEEGANMLALGTRLSLATTALAIGSQQNQAIGNLIASGIQA